MPRFLTITAIAAYIVAGFLTYGWRMNNAGSYEYPADIQQVAVMGGAFWPLYWASYPISWLGEASIAVTRQSDRGV